MAVINHEIPDLRRQVRSELPLDVRIDNLRYSVKDWSPDGFCIEGVADGSFEVGQQFPVEIIVAHQGMSVSFTTEVEVVRQSSGHLLATRFLDLKPCERDLLDTVCRGANGSGKHAALGVPVTLTPALPTPQEAPAPGWLGLILKRLVFSLFYWTAGLALGAVIVLILYWHFFRLDLESSVVSLPLYPVISQDVARCQSIFVKEGDVVRAGDPLLRVEDDLLTRDLEVAEIQLAVAKVDLETALGRVQKEKDKLALYEEITLSRLEKANAQVDSLTLQVKTCNAMMDRLKLLMARKGVAKEDVEALEVKRLELIGNLGMEKAEQRIAEQALRTLKEGAFYDGRRLVGDFQQYLVNLNDAQQRHRIAADRVKLAGDRVKRLTYTAPFDGKVVKLFNTVGGTMNRGEVLAVLEKTGEEPVIDCFLTQDEANSLALRTQATIWIPALEKTYSAEVVKIDRTSGFLTEMQANLKDAQLRYNGRGAQDRSAYVQLVFSEELTSEEWQELAGGMPVIVSVPRTPPLWPRIQALFR